MKKLFILTLLIGFIVGCGKPEAKPKKESKEPVVQDMNIPSNK